MNLIDRINIKALGYESTVSYMTLSYSVLIGVSSLAGSLVAEIAKNVLNHNATVGLIGGSLLYISKVALLTGLVSLISVPVELLVINIISRMNSHSISLAGFKLSILTVACCAGVGASSLVLSHVPQIVKDVLLQNATVDIICRSLLHVSKIAFLTGIGAIAIMIVSFVGVLFTSFGFQSC